MAAVEYPCLAPRSDEELHYYISRLIAVESECRILRKRLEEVDFLRSQKAELVSALEMIAGRRPRLNKLASDIARDALGRLETVKD